MGDSCPNKEDTGSACFVLSDGTWGAGSVSGHLSVFLSFFFFDIANVVID